MLPGVPGLTAIACMVCLFVGMRSAPRAEAVDEVVADAKRVGHDRERRIDGAARWEEARVDDVEIVEIVGLAVGVERRRPGVAAEADRAVLMRHAGERNALSDVEVAREQADVTVAAVNGA